jgi:hypothetical protein
MGPEQRREIISRLFTTEAQRKTNSRNAVSCFLVSLCLRGERLLRESSPTFFELYFRRMWASLRNSKLSRAQIKTGSALILFCALAKGRSSGTELVMVVEKNRIVLAADSLVTDDPEHQSMRRCKIRQSGSDNYFYAVSGISSDHEIGFDSDSLFAKRRKNIHGAASLDAIGATFLPHLQKELEVIRKEAPNRYNEFVQQGHMEALFVVDTFGNAKEGYVKDFNISNGRVVATPARSCIVQGDSKVRRCTISSENSRMKNPVSEAGDIVQSIHKIMDAAMSARPNEVGPPISILDIGPHRQPRWLEPGLCGEIREVVPIKKQAAPEVK